MINDIRLALAFLTRLPFPPLPALPDGALARAMGVFPLVGALVGAIGGGTFALAHTALPAGLAALIALAATIGVTGALHEDGLADLADGLGGGTDKAGKLAIMRDSRIGSFGAITLLFSLALRAGALASLATPGLAAGALIAAHALARAAIPVAMQAFAPARQDGLGAGAGQPAQSTATSAAGLALVIAWVALPTDAALAAGAGAAIATAAIVILARRQIGGHTGDVLGAVEQAAETAALLAVAASL